MIGGEVSFLQPGALLALTRCPVGDGRQGACIEDDMAKDAPTAAPKA
jgi:hypothetical protein